VVILEQGVLQAIPHHLRKRLAKFRMPKHLAFMAELPHNVMGNVQK
jgi:hypothetical protein